VSSHIDIDGRLTLQISLHLDMSVDKFRTSLKTLLDVLTALKPRFTSLEHVNVLLHSLSSSPENGIRGWSTVGGDDGSGTQEGSEELQKSSHVDAMKRMERKENSSRLKLAKSIFIPCETIANRAPHLLDFGQCCQTILQEQGKVKCLGTNACLGLGDPLSSIKLTWLSRLYIAVCFKKRETRQSYRSYNFCNLLSHKAVRIRGQVITE
jgi:hypothetical protein